MGAGGQDTTSEGWPETGMSERCAKAIHKAKKEIRSELKPAAWSRRGYWKSDATALPKTLDNLTRIHCKDVTPEQFFKRFEVTAQPVVIDGFLEGTAAKDWSAKSLLARFGERAFKCGEDDEGYPERVKLKHFMEYCETEGQTDDSPLYVFDSKFATQTGAKKTDSDSDSSSSDSEQERSLLADYELPSYFRDDLFKLVGSKRRPPWRWFMIGPRNSGTGIHTDPLGTSAWNMLAQGHKRWCVFPPDCPRHLLKPDEYKGVDREAISWFQEVLPKLIKDHPELAARRIDFVQRPGETVFVPGDWWHVVTNLETTVAVTQNLLMPAMLPEVWPKLAANFESFAGHFARRLRRHRPEVIADLERRGVMSMADYETADSDGEDDEHEGFRL